TSSLKSGIRVSSVMTELYMDPYVNGRESLFDLWLARTYRRRMSQQVKGERVTRHRWSKSAVILIAVVAAAAVAACGSNNERYSSSQPAAKQAYEKKANAGPIAIGTSVDMKSGYGKALLVGVNRIRNELGNKVDIAQQVPPAKFASTLQDFATRG